jgi:hypothetical protein
MGPAYQEIAMSIISAKDAMLQHLVLVQPAWPTAYENIEFTPTPNSPWMRAQMLFTGPFGMGPGAQTVEEWKGVLQVSLFTPLGESSDMALQHFEAIRNHFPHGKNLTNDGFTVTVTDVTHHTGMREPDWFHLPVSIHWQGYSYSIMP